MPETKSVLLPVNLVEDIRYKDKSIYRSDYCTRNRRIPERHTLKTNETSLYARDTFDPSTRFLNDHYQTSSHLDLKKHCEKVLNSIERGSMVKTDNYFKIKGPVRSNISPTPFSSNKDEPISNFLQPTIRKIESAWETEVNGTKRERGDAYGKAGRKLWYNERKDSASNQHCKEPMIPRVGKWLNEANEFEKQIVYNFMKNVSIGLEERNPCSRIEDIDQATSPDHASYSDNPKIEDYIDSNPDVAELLENSEVVRMETPAVQQDDEFSLLDEPKGQRPLSRQHITFGQSGYYSNEARYQSPNENELMMQNHDLSFQKPIENHRHSPINRKQRSKAKKVMIKEQMEDIDYNPVDSYYGDKEREGIHQIGLVRPKSTQRYYESQEKRLPKRAMSADSIQKRSSHFHRHSHGDATCTNCHNLQIAQLAKDLSVMEPSSYENLKRERHSKPKMVAANMYKATWDDYMLANDYIHKGSVFKKVSKRSPGYFIIHPEWISEKVVQKKSYR